MTPDQIADIIDEYIAWVHEQPFGAPTDTGTYIKHLEVQELLRGEG